MKLKSLCIPLVFLPALSANPYAICNAGATSIPVFSTSSTSGEVADYTLNCTGTTAPTGPVPVIDVDAMLNVPILSPGTWTLVDGATDIPGTLKTPTDVEFVGVPFGLSSGTENFTIEGIFVNPSGEGPGFEFEETDSITFDAAITVNNQEQEVGVNATPEPSALWLTVLGLGAVWFARKTRNA
jgi:hypothetical protein